MFFFNVTTHLNKTESVGFPFFRNFKVSIDPTMDSCLLEKEQSLLTTQKSGTIHMGLMLFQNIVLLKDRIYLLSLWYIVCIWNAIVFFCMLNLSCVLLIVVFHFFGNYISYFVGEEGLLMDIVHIVAGTNKSLIILLLTQCCKGGPFHEQSYVWQIFPTGFPFSFMVIR